MNEDAEIIDTFEICFQELKDRRNTVIINYRYYTPIDFTKGHVIDVRDIRTSFKPNKPYFYIEIHKDYFRPFNIKDIMEYLLFTEAYIKDLYNLTIEHLFVLMTDTYKGYGYFYDDIKYLPLDENIMTINIYFTKY